MSKERRQMLAVGLAVGLALFGDLSLYAALVTQLEATGLNLVQVGILLSVHRVIRIPANPLVGMLLNRFGRRPLFVLGAALGVISTALYGLGYGFWQFLVARLMWGLAWALLNVGGLTIALDLASPANRGRLSGMYNTWIWIGFAVGPLIGGFLVDWSGFRTAMLACAGISAVGLAAAAFFLEETRPPERAAQAGAFSLGERLAGYWSAGVEVLRGSPAGRRAMALNSLMLFASDGVILGTVALLLEERMGGALAVGVASASGLLIALRSVLAAVSSSFAGRLSDGRLGRAWLISAALVCGALAFGVLAVARSLGLLLLGAALSAVSSGAGLAVLAALIGDVIHPDRQSASVGVYAAAGDIGSASGPAFAYALLPSIGLSGVYAISAGLLAAGLLLIPRDFAGLQQNHHEIETNF